MVKNLLVFYHVICSNGAQPDLTSFHYVMYNVKQILITMVYVCSSLDIVHHCESFQ